VAPKYAMRVERVPQPGKTFEVLNAVLAFRIQARIAIGITTLELFSPTEKVVTATPFHSMQTAQVMPEDTLGDVDRREALEAISSLCTSTNITLARIIEQPEGINTASWIQRYHFHHDPNSQADLIEALREMRSRYDGPKGAIAASLNSPTVLVTTAVESLSAIEAFGDAALSDPDVMALTSAVLDHTKTWTSEIGKIFHP